MNSLTFDQGVVDPPPLWAILMSKIPSNHTLGQGFLFVATPIVNNFERAKISSNSLTCSQGPTSVGPNTAESKLEGFYVSGNLPVHGAHLLPHISMCLPLSVSPGVSLDTTLSWTFL